MIVPHRVVPDMPSLQLPVLRYGAWSLYAYFLFTAVESTCADDLGQSHLRI